MTSPKRSSRASSKRRRSRTDKTAILLIILILGALALVDERFREKLFETFVPFITTRV